jgi:hypothetical protein
MRKEVATAMKGIRRRSTKMVCGLPLYDIALGPDPEKGEIRGRACGILAIGDIAKGIVAIGGGAIGVIAFGGGALGIVAIGGGALGVVALGGGAIGAIAVGGCALGIVAVGGGSIGYYAHGPAAMGKYVVNLKEHSSQAVQFFRHWMPWLPGL